MDKKLDLNTRLQYALVAVGVLRTLRLLDTTMRYNQFATAIGLKPESEGWQPWHRQQVRDILNLVAAIEKQAGTDFGDEPLEFERIVKGDGQPGTGVHNVSRIVTESA